MLVATIPVPPELVGLTLYEKDEKLCRRWPGLLPQWKLAYPGVDVMAEVKKAHAWELANSLRVKKDRARYLNGWLARAQDAPRTTQVPKRVSEFVPSRDRSLARRTEAPIEAVAMKRLLTQANLLRKQVDELPTAQELALAKDGRLSDAIQSIKDRVSCCSTQHALEILKRPAAGPAQQVPPEEYL